MQFAYNFEAKNFRFRLSLIQLIKSYLTTSMPREKRKEKHAYQLKIKFILLLVAILYSSWISVTSLILRSILVGILLTLSSAWLLLAHSFVCNVFSKEPRDIQSAICWKYFSRSADLCIWPLVRFILMPSVLPFYARINEASHTPCSC